MRLLGLLARRRLVVAVVALAGMFVLFFPARALVSQRERIGELEERRSALRSENAKLATQVARLEDPEQLEVLARERLGLVRPGERAYFVEPTQTPPPPAPKVEDDSAWGKVWSWVTSLVRGRG